MAEINPAIAAARQMMEQSNREVDERQADTTAQVDGIQKDALGSSSSKEELANAVRAATAAMSPQAPSTEVPQAPVQEGQPAPKQPAKTSMTSAPGGQPRTNAPIWSAGKK